MFNRFTERARKVLVLAKEEARRFNHDYIGTEHILLGLIREGEGVACAVLQNLGVDLERLRIEIEKLISPGSSASVLGEIPFTPREPQDMILLYRDQPFLLIDTVGMRKKMYILDATVKKNITILQKKDAPSTLEHLRSSFALRVKVKKDRISIKTKKEATEICEEVKKKFRAGIFIK